MSDSLKKLLKDKIDNLQEVLEEMSTSKKTETELSESIDILLDLIARFPNLIDTEVKKINETILELQKKLDAIKFIKGEKGDKGKDAIVDYPFIIEEVLTQIPTPKDGKDGKDLLLEEDELVSRINQIDGKVKWDVLENFESLVNQDTLKKAIQTLENQTRYLIQRTSSGISNITGLITAGSGISITGSGTSGDPYEISASGGSGTPDLPFQSVQFNDNGSFGGVAEFSWNLPTDPITNILTLNNLKIKGFPDTATTNAGSIYMVVEDIPNGYPFPDPDATQALGNLVIGSAGAGRYLTTGAYNLLLGPETGQSLTEGGANIFLLASGRQVTTGNGNFFMGVGSGDNVITGSNNIAIGGASTPSGDFSDTIAFGNNSNPTASNQFVLGSGANNISEARFGITTLYTDGMFYIEENDGAEFFNGRASITTGGGINSGIPDPMTVNGTAITANFQANSNTLSVYENHTHTDTPSIGSLFYFARSRGTTVSPTAVQNGDALGSMLFVGYDGTDYATSAGIQVTVDGAPGSNDMPGKMSFFTSPDGSQTLAERMHISPSGNVNIAGLTASKLVLTDASKNLVSDTGTDLTVSGTAISIANNAVTDAKLRDSGPLSVIGRSANSTGDPADISGTASTKQVLRISGTTLGFGTIDNTYISDFTEAAQDATGAMAGTYLVYDDANNLLNVKPPFEWNCGQAGDTVAAGTTAYMSVKANTSADNATESNRQTVSGYACRASTVYVALRTAQPATGSLVFTLRVNGVDTALVLTIAAGSGVGVYNTSTNVNVSAGDLLTWKVTNNATTASASISDITTIGTIT